jgi:hypothetical protein
VTTPGREPGEAPDADDPERAARARRIARALQAGGIVFLAVVSIGLLPTILSASFPALGPRFSVIALIVAPALPIALLVVAAFRIRR